MIIDAPINKLLSVVSINDYSLSIRLLEFGIHENSKIKVVRKAPLHGPLHIASNQIQFLLRYSDAKLIDTITVED